MDNKWYESGTTAVPADKKSSYMRQYTVSPYILIGITAAILIPGSASATIATCRGNSADVTRCLQNAFTYAQRAGDGEVYFPEGTYTIDQPLVIPNKTAIIGAGRGDAGITGTTILASSTFPVGQPLVQMGPAPGPNFGVRVTNLTLNCNARASIGLQNMYSEEQSYGRDLLITNCGGIGLDVEGGAAQNSGPFQDLEIYPGSGSSVNTTTLCVKIQNAVAFRGLIGVTCNAGSYYSTRPDVALQIDGSASYQDIHVEHFTTGIVLGSNVTSADGTSIINTQFGPDVATGILIQQQGSPNQNLMILGASCFNCSSLLTDQLTNNNITDSSLGWYFIGNGANGGKSLFTSKYGTPYQVEGPLSAWNTALGPGNTQSWGTVSIWDATPQGVTSVVEAQGAGQDQTNLFEWRDRGFGLLANVAWDGSFHTPLLQLLPGPTLDCDASRRGTQQFNQGSVGVADHFYVCAQRDGGSYAWVPVF